MKKNKISIILPAYNCADFIDRCLESLKNQTYNDIEVVIIDDGSKDSTQENCKKFIERNNLNNFFYYYQENTGVSGARNNGIEKATGDLIMFIDADDWLENDCVERLYNQYTQDNSQLVVSNFTNVKLNGEQLLNKFKKPKNNAKKTFLLNILSPAVSNSFEENTYSCSRTVWGKLYIKEIITKNNIKFRKNIKLLEDGIFNLEYVQKIGSISYIDKSLYYYFDNSVSASKKFYPNRVEEDSIKINVIESLIDDSDKDFKNAKQVLYIDLFFSSMQKSLFNKKNSMSFSKKRKKLKEIVTSTIYKNLFDKDANCYIDSRKKLILTLLSLKLYTLVSLLLMIYSIF